MIITDAIYKELAMSREDVINEIEKNKDQIGIIDYIYNDKSIKLITKAGYENLAARFISKLVLDYPDFVSGGHTATE